MHYAHKRNEHYIASNFVKQKSLFGDPKLGFPTVKLSNAVSFLERRETCASLAT